ncbi:MAG: AmmeMemoRadiSam system protein A, partial [Bacillota bacterium]
KLVELIEDKRFEEILRLDPQLIEKAGECGLRPLIIMLGSLDGLGIRTEVKSYEGPFGVGYAVASFKIKGVE